MRIARIRTRPVRHSYEPQDRLEDASYSIDHRETLLVEVEDEDGAVGLGEAVTFGGGVQALETVILEDLGPRLLGQNPLDRQRLWNDMYYGSLQRGRKGLVLIAISGLDSALWDLCARTLGIPLHRLLGGYQSRVRAYASGGFYQSSKRVDDLVDEMVSYAARGFRALKMKIGRGPIRDDVIRVREVRHAVGEEIRLMVDANRAYRLEEAVRVARALENLHVAVFEEPLPPDDLDGYRRLATRTDLAIAAGENEYGLFGFRDLIDTGGVSIVQPDLSWSGGITAALKIAAYAEARHLEISPHALSSCVNLLGTLHFLGSVPNAGWLEFDQTDNPLRTALGAPSLEVGSDGCIEIPDRPGHGLVLEAATTAPFEFRPVRELASRQPTAVSVPATAHADRQSSAVSGGD